MISQITLTNFRNHERFRLITDNKNVILIGANGTGKTNILEAVSLLNGSQGLRSASAQEIAKDGASDYAIAAEIKSGESISVYWNGSGNRKSMINGESSTLSELSKYMAIIWLTPKEDLIFISSPSARRDFFDNLIAGFDHNHYGRVHRLTKLLSERTYALKNGNDERWLDLIENNIAASAVAIADARVKYAGELNHFFESGKIAISGMLEQMIINGEKAGWIEDFYRNYLSENRFLVEGKSSIDGAHRTNFSVINTILNKSADMTSSGQQKMLLYKLISSNSKLLKSKKPDMPLLILLDEAFGHLDRNAQQNLFAELQKTSAQIWITGTEWQTQNDNWKIIEL